MLVLILSIILIGLAGLERSIYTRKNNSLNKVRLFIGVLIICLLFFISYFITDTNIGVFYVFFSTTTLTFISIVNCRGNVKWIKYSSFIIGLPLSIYLIINATQNMLIDPRYIFLLLFVTNLILSYSYEQRRTAKENIAFAIGIVFAVTLMFSYIKLSDSEDIIMVKQELVAQKYLEEELGMYGLEVYTRNISRGLRGEETTVKAYDSSGNFVLLTYKNNQIISYDIKDN